MANTPFTFKSFSVMQDRCAMKIGTDGVLLGAWAGIAPDSDSSLDIGAGTGILSLMLAQRSSITQIDAIEIDENAYEQCVENFEQSPWSDRLFCFHAGLDELVEEIEQTYDTIISNPPFYTEQVACASQQRDTARNENALPFSELLDAVAKLLSKQGYFNVIIPYKEEEQFIILAKKHNLYPLKITRVQGNKQSPIKRSLLCFSFTPQTPSIDTLCIEEKRHQYTPQYIALTKDFYLKM